MLTSTTLAIATTVLVISATELAVGAFRSGRQA